MISHSHDGKSNIFLDVQNINDIAAHLLPRLDYKYSKKPFSNLLQRLQVRKLRILK